MGNLYGKMWKNMDKNMEKCGKNLDKNMEKLENVHKKRTLFVDP
jgi:hypothetical protein